MGTRFLTFHKTEPAGNEIRMSPSAYFIERNYTPIAVRIYAEKAPLVDAFVDIFVGGVSIFNDRTPTQYELSTGIDITGEALTAGCIGAGQTSENYAEDFALETIAKDSWVYATIQCGGGRNFSVQFEIYSEDEEAAEE